MALIHKQLICSFVRSKQAIYRRFLAGYVRRRNLTLKAATDSLQIDWEDGSAVSSYPYIFLRDNCQCEKCFHSTAKQRISDTAFTVPINIKPDSVWHADESVNLKWEDGHESAFQKKWLQDRKFPATDLDVRPRSSCGLKPRTWGSELNDKLPRYDFKKMMKDDSEFLSWLESVAVIGIALVNDVPQGMEPYSKFSEKLFCPIRSTHYGYVACID